MRIEMYVYEDSEMCDIDTLDWLCNKTEQLDISIMSWLSLPKVLAEHVLYRCIGQWGLLPPRTEVTFHHQHELWFAKRDQSDEVLCEALGPRHFGRWTANLSNWPRGSPNLAEPAKRVWLGDLTKVGRRWILLHDRLAHPSRHRTGRWFVREWLLAPSLHFWVCFCREINWYCWKT